MDPRFGLGSLEEREISCSCLESNPISSCIQPTAYSLLTATSFQLMNLQIFLEYYFWPTLLHITLVSVEMQLLTQNSVKCKGSGPE